MSVQKKRVLVTASSSGLGASIASRFAAGGAAVAVHYRQNRAAGATVLAGLAPPAAGAHALVSADLADPDGPPQLLAEASQEMGGPPDIVVNNCGPFALTALRDTPVREWDDVLDTNLRAAWLLSCLAAPSMQAAGWGRIVNVSAGSGYVRNHSVYGLAKGALNLLTEQLAIELGPAVTVNAVAPGQIAESADVIAEYDSEFVDRFIAQSPLGRLVRRDEVADCIAALCGPAFDMVTGVVVPIDGGCRIPRF